MNIMVAVFVRGSLYEIRLVAQSGVGIALIEYGISYP